MGLVLAVLGLAVLAGPGTAVGERGCRDPERLYAVAARNGHLTSAISCGTGGFGPVTEIDDRDWRVYRDVFATQHGSRALVYALGRDGTLWAFPHHASRADLGRPVQVGRARQWAAFRLLFASRPGYLHGMRGNEKVVRTFRHHGRSFREVAPLLGYFPYDRMSAFRAGSFGEANVPGMHVRIWQVGFTDGMREFLGGEVVPSGALPAGVRGVSGAEPTLYGLDGRGAIVRMHQPVPADWDCQLQATQPWRITARLAGAYTKVVRPAVGTVHPRPVPTISGLPAEGEEKDCPMEPIPWEWQ